ncbi:molybdate ABC transporter substrate-binding protein [Paenibacillus abyssi]|uniref:Molybdate ABC transporter substrate-binding protein n=1 Tax=Paenibacillus abyssi TaxID=1340531 RepID=A0A917FMG9_9BACL|nr:molybdate ABC transporter substrate-binding protein [Paenibacillus abyssi]GGF92698.1 molybdate ABC transporter substrate-binding protein [Paenibacillus abyssi]
MLKPTRFHAALLIIIALLTVLLSGCGTPSNASSQIQTGDDPAELIISAAASLTGALKDIQTGFEAKHPSVQLTFNFGSSGALQQQIEQGAPVDVFLSAGVSNMEALVDKGLVDPAMKTTLLMNRLVVVVPNDGQAVIAVMADLLKEDVKSVAIGIPESVPAGGYAKEAMIYTALWDKLQPKLVQAKDVRQVLHYVETGNSDAGFVYQTDALSTKSAKVAFTVDPGSYQPIEYPIAITKASKQQEEAELFYTYLQSEEALSIFKDYGFSLPE